MNVCSRALAKGEWYLSYSPDERAPDTENERMIPAGISRPDDW
jgi:hypothetical protein